MIKAEFSKAFDPMKAIQTKYSLQLTIENLDKTTIMMHNWAKIVSLFGCIITHIWSFCYNLIDVPATKRKCVAGTAKCNEGYMRSSAWLQQ